jgi:hypothetical protein
MLLQAQSRRQRPLGRDVRDAIPYKTRPAQTKGIEAVQRAAAGANVVDTTD